MSVSEEQSEQKDKLATKSFMSTYDISSIKHVTRKFAVVKTDNKKKFIKKKSAMHVQSCVLLIRPSDFFPFLVPSPFDINNMIYDK